MCRDQDEESAMNARPSPTPSPVHAALRIALIYAVFGALWIVLSDRALEWITGSPERAQRWQTPKGWFYIAATAALVYFFVLRYGRRLHQVLTELARHRDHLEELVRERTTELEAVNRELEAFCYSVSHDLRAPVRQIAGFADALTADCGDRLTDACRRHVQAIRDASREMGQLIDALLDLSRVTQAELHPTDVELSALAAEVVAGLRQAYPQRQVEVAIAPGLRARGDARLLRVVLTNLLGNAWKFTGRTPAPKIEVGRAEREGRPVFWVRDNGAGFDMQFADKLFGAFQRLHSAQEFEGSGVGLATVQRIVHRHGGQVWAEATVGQGATFCFTLAAPPTEP
jgi:light-regulated signal transduction histidine kinase (bacteriophytochrome)